MEGIVDVWKKETAEWITPKTEVYAIRWFNKYFPKGLLFNYAYTSETAMKNFCWWWKTADIKPNLKVEKILFEDYILLHQEECPAMNPFWGIGRAEFINEYAKKLLK